MEGTFMSTKVSMCRIEADYGVWGVAIVQVLSLGCK